MNTATWLLLLYALPMRRNAERVSLWRKLRKFGAVQLKTSGYVLPDDSVQYERLQWLARQIQDAGGEATLIRMAEIDGISREQIVGMFNEARGADYKELATACRTALSRKKKGKQGELADELKRQRRRFSEIREIDYFNSPAAHDAQMLLERMENALAPQKDAAQPGRLHRREFVGKTWLTRPRPGIDRAGSAWLIRKFIDPRAKFVFGMNPQKVAHALPFDMAGVEFSHHGDDCTFETLIKRFGIRDRTVLQIAEMVHDADLEDSKFQRLECIGINSVLSGWARSAMSDDELLAKGIECFEGLYQDLKQ